MARKIIIDTDPGVDDSMAIFLALRSPELEVVGLTTVFGNVTSALATTNALRLLEIAGRPDIPVARGAADPLTRAFEGPVPAVHGADGQGDINLPAPKGEPLGLSAAEFIVEQVKANRGQITLAPIGPLTNIALALRLEPRLALWVDEVVLMGGNALVPGNASPAAEANIRNDPEAADLVFGADWRVTMVGLDVTLRAHMRPQDIAAYASNEGAMARHITAILPHYRRYFEANYDIEGIFVHDSSAIAYLLAPDLFSVRRWEIRVGAQGLGRGKTWPATGGSLLPAWEGRPQVNVCVGVDGPAVVQLAAERILRASAPNL